MIQIRNQKGPVYLLIIVCWAFLLFFLHLGDKGLWSSQEARNALAARTMLKGPLQEWIMPTIQYEQSTQKPVFYYWLVALSCWAGSNISPFLVRLPAALSGLLCVLYIYFLCSRAVNKKTAFITALILLTSIKFLAMSRTSRIDIFLTLCLTCTLGELYLFRSERKRVHLILAYLFTAFGVLSKGPVAIILPGAIFSVFLFMNKELHTFLRYFHPTAIAVFLITVLPYYILADHVTGGSFFHDFIVLHNVERFTGKDGVFGDRKPFWFYMPHLLTGMLPWTLLSPLLLLYYRFKKATGSFLCVTNKNNNEINIFASYLFLWAAIIFIFFSLASFKRSDYILPVIPPLAVLFGIAFSDISFLTDKTRWLKTSIIAISAGLMILLPMLVTARISSLPETLSSVPLIQKYFNYNDKITFIAITDFLKQNTAMLLLLIGSVISLFLFNFLYKRSNPRLTFITILLSISLCYLFYFSRLQPYIDVYKSLDEFAEAVKQETGSQPLGFYRVWNHQLFFDIDREIQMIYGPDTLFDFCIEKPPAYFVIEEKYLRQIPEKYLKEFTLVTRTRPLHAKNLILMKYDKTGQSLDTDKIESTAISDTVSVE